MRRKEYKYPEDIESEIKNLGGIRCPRCKNVYKADKHNWGWNVGWPCPPCQIQVMDIREGAKLRGRAYRARKKAEMPELLERRAANAERVRRWRASKAAGSDAHYDLRRSARVLREYLLERLDAPWDAP